MSWALVPEVAHYEDSDPRSAEDDVWPRRADTLPHVIAEPTPVKLPAKGQLRSCPKTALYAHPGAHDLAAGRWRRWNEGHFSRSSGNACKKRADGKAQRASHPDWYSVPDLSLDGVVAAEPAVSGGKRL